MFLKDSNKHESDLCYEPDRDISLYELLDFICDGDENLFFKLIDEQRNLRSHVNIFIGSRNCRDLDGIDSRLSGSADVSVFPALSGG